MSTESYKPAKPWLNAYPEGVPEHVNFENMTMSDYFDRSVREFPYKTALNFMGYRLTYTQLNHMVMQFAGFLYKSGIRKGDSVAITLPNIIPFVAAYFAILRIGGVVVTNNPLYTDSELLHQFKNSNAKAVVVLDLLADRVIALKEKCSIENIIVASIGDYLPFPKSILFPLVAKRKKLTASVKKGASIYSWKDLIREKQPDHPKASITFDDIAA